MKKAGRSYFECIETVSPDGRKMTEDFTNKMEAETGQDVQHPDKFRTLFWNDKEGFAVWRDKRSHDQGTAYFPDDPDAFKKKWGLE